MKSIRLLLLYAVVLLSNCAPSRDTVQTTLPSIEKSSGNHILHYSNKNGSFWSFESRNYFSHWSTGYVSHRERIFGDIRVQVDGYLLPRDSSTISYTPIFLERFFPSGVKEISFMPDHRDMAIVQLSNLNARSIAVILDDVALRDGTVPGTLPHDSTGVTIPLRHSINTQMHITVRDGFVTNATAGPSRLIVTLEPTSSTLTLMIQIGGRAEDSIDLDPAALMEEKSRRITALVETRTFDTDDQRLDDAWVWALRSFDALNMNEEATGMGKGIYAGYPWFQDYWGRDSFIALRALTVTGQYELAADNLGSFLKFQQLDTTSTDYGKIPNRVRPDEIIYNTADATPRFMIEADRYVAYSGDTAFARRIFPNIDAAVRGTLRHRTDSSALSVHGAADTWMDAVGPNGPYSPRGDRAVDIQALWIDALKAASNLLRYVRGTRATETAQIAEQTRAKAMESFQILFNNPAVDPTQPAVPSLFDAIRQDGSPSSEIRPNALFAAHLLPGTQSRLELTKQITQRLGTPWGLTSLDPGDPNYLPYHKAEPLYEQDASYHNGIVWLWNSGIWLEMLLRHGHLDQAWEVTKNYVDLMLDNVTLGTLPELIDAVPRKEPFITNYPDSTHFPGISRLDQMSIRNEAEVDPDIPALSGAWSQAWSLSEFLRNIAEDYVGLRYEAEAGFVLKPKLPAEWGNVLATRTFAGYSLELRRIFVRGQISWLMRIEGSASAAPLSVTFFVPGMEHPVLLKLTPGEQRFEIRQNRGKMVITRNSETILPDPAPPSGWME